MQPIPAFSEPAGPVAEVLAVQRLAMTSRDIASIWGRSHLRTSLRNGAVTRLLPDVYVATAVLDDDVVRARAVSTWKPLGLITGTLALRLYAPDLSAPEWFRADVIVPATHHLRPPAWVHAHQTGPLRGLSKPFGVRCALPERALLDAWIYSPTRARPGIFYEALWRRVCHWSQLRREVDRAPRIPQRALLRGLLDEFAAGATSPLEVRARREVFRGKAFADFERQVSLRLRPTPVTVDMLHRKARLVVELDGKRYHSGADAVAADNERSIALAAAGYLTIRFTWNDVVTRPGWVRQQVLAITANRLSAPLA